MTNETYITVRGWVGVDASFYDNDAAALSGSESSTGAALFTVGVTARSFSSRKKAYVDTSTAWYSVRCYGSLAQNVARSVRKGAPVLVRGKLVSREYTDKNGAQRSAQVIIADSVAIDLNSVVATYHKSSRDGAQGETGASLSERDGRSQFSADPWSATAPNELKESGQAEEMEPDPQGRAEGLRGEWRGSDSELTASEQLGVEEDAQGVLAQLTS